MKLTERYQIDGKEMPVPDAGVVMTFRDIDAEESGRDEAGFFHRIPLRYQVGSWEFTYSRLSQEAYSYLLDILPRSGSFLFARPGREDVSATEESLCSLTSHKVTLHTLPSGVYRELKFTVTEC